MVPKPLELAADEVGAAKILAAARLAGVEVQLRPGGCAARTPCGLPVPELEHATGRVKYLNPILRRVAESGFPGTGLLGNCFTDEGQVDSWLEWVMLEIDHSGEDADTKRICGVLEAHLKGRTHLVGSRVSLADISAVLSLRPLLEKAGLGDPSASFPGVARWLRTCTQELELGPSAAEVPGRGPGPAKRSAAKSSAAAAAPPPFPYTEGSVTDSRPAAVYWAWFRKGLGTRLYAAAKAAGCADVAQAVLAAPTAEGLVRTCAEAFGKPLSEAEALHLQQAPVSASWLKELLQEATTN